MICRCARTAVILRNEASGTCRAGSLISTMTRTHPLARISLRTDCHVWDTCDASRAARDGFPADKRTTKAATAAANDPRKIKNSLALMRVSLLPTRCAGADAPRLRNRCAGMRCGYEPFRREGLEDEVRMRGDSGQPLDQASFVIARTILPLP